MPRTIRRLRLLALAALISLTRANETSPASLTPKEFETLKAQANFSDADAQFRLGMLYLKGEGGIEKDPAKAKLWLTNAAMQNHTEAAFELGRLAGESGDREGAIKWVKQAAQNGHVNAMIELGAALLKTPGESAEGVKWLKAACDAGNPHAQELLGILYTMGKFVPQNTPAGIALLESAAQSGRVGAMGVMGTYYADDESNHYDEKKALHWLKKASEGRSAVAERQIAAAYARGELGLEKNRYKSRLWYASASAHGDEDATALIAKLARWEDDTRRQAGEGDQKARFNLGLELLSHGDEQKRTEGLRWLETAAASGSAEAESMLAAYHAGLLPGTPTPKPDFDKAGEWMKLAVSHGAKNAEKGSTQIAGLRESLKKTTALTDKGDPDAAFELAQRYETGNGVSLNIAEARRLYSLAAAKGHAEAKSKLDLLLDLPEPPRRHADNP